MAQNPVRKLVKNQTDIETNCKTIYFKALALNRLKKRSIVSDLFGNNGEKLRNLEKSVRSGVEIENKNFAKIEHFSSNIVSQINRMAKLNHKKEVSMKKQFNTQLILARKLHRMGGRHSFLNLR